MRHRLRLARCSAICSLDDAAAGEVPLHFPASAKHVIHLFMNGGPSHVDTFDPKQALKRLHGKTAPTKNLRTERPTGNVMESPYKFKQYGECGLPVSELFTHTAQHMDDICVDPIDARGRPQSRTVADADEHRRVASGASQHGVVDHLRAGKREPEPAGVCRDVPGRLSDQGIPELAERVSARASTRPPMSTPEASEIEQLIDNIRNKGLATRRSTPATRSVAAIESSITPSSEPDDPRLESRIESFELAYRMQSEATEAFDITRETEQTLRDVRRGRVRPTDVDRAATGRTGRSIRAAVHGAGQPWDNHDDLEPHRASRGPKV